MTTTHTPRRPRDRSSTPGVVVRLVAGAAALWALFVALGELIVRVWAPSRLGHDDAAVDRYLAAHRTGELTFASMAVERLADTLTVIILTALVVIGLYLARRRWREPLFLLVVVVGEVATFIAITAIVNRHRPPVAHLDASPPTSSFPSGHTAASVALYGGIAVLCSVLLRRHLVRGLIWVVAALVPLLVAAARLYRGMHFPTDVLSGGLLGVLWLGWVGRVYPLRTAPPGKGPSPREAGVTAVVVLNPTKGGTVDRGAMTDALAREGVVDVTFAETTAEDPGVGQSRAAVESGADLVIAWGGDGTVMACVTGMAGSDTPLAIVAAGTGNLLARNLNIPLGLAEGVAVAVRGERRRIDVGAVGDRRFAVMAGMGFDAAMLRDASEGAKARVGPAAYLVSGLRNLTERGFDCTVTVDGGTPLHRRARTVLVGNVGKLQGGLPVLPDAVPDDGELDAVVMSPRTVLDWAGVAWRVALRRAHPRHMDALRGRRILIESATEQPYELDGEVLGHTVTMLCEVQPQALLLCVPLLHNRGQG